MLPLQNLLYGSGMILGGSMYMENGTLLDRTKLVNDAVEEYFTA